MDLSLKKLSLSNLQAPMCPSNPAITRCSPFIENLEWITFKESCSDIGYPYICYAYLLYLITSKTVKEKVSMA